MFLVQHPEKWSHKSKHLHALLYHQTSENPTMSIWQLYGLMMLTSPGLYPPPILLDGSGQLSFPLSPPINTWAGLHLTQFQLNITEGNKVLHLLPHHHVHLHHVTGKSISFFSPGTSFINTFSPIPRVLLQPLSNCPVLTTFLIPLTPSYTWNPKYSQIRDTNKDKYWDSWVVQSVKYWLLISGQVLTWGSWVQASHWAPCWAWPTLKKKKKRGRRRRKKIFFLNK